jgi:hypothetical protein
MGDNGPATFDSNDFDLDGCNMSEVTMFLQKLARSPNASAMNMAFTKHITNALMQIREEKLKQKNSIPRKLEDGWEPIIKLKVNDFDCNALWDLGASISVMPRKIYYMLGLLMACKYSPLGTLRGRYDEHSSKSSLSYETKVYRTSRRKPNFRR